MAGIPNRFQTQSKTGKCDLEFWLFQMHSGKFLDLRYQVVFNFESLLESSGDLESSLCDILAVQGQGSTE